MYVLIGFDNSFKKKTKTRKEKVNLEIWKMQKTIVTWQTPVKKNIRESDQLSRFCHRNLIPFGYRFIYVCRMVVALNNLSHIIGYAA